MALKPDDTVCFCFHVTLRKVEESPPTVRDDEAVDAEAYLAGRKRYIGDGQGTPPAGAEE